MEYYLLIVMVIIGAIGCHGQFSTDLSPERLHTRVRQLEDTVVQLLNKLDEMKVSQSATKNYDVQRARKRGYIYPALSVDPADGLTLQRSLNGDEVGFSLSLKQDQELEIGTKIIFDNVGENIRQAYSEAAGEFVCPASGTYLFSLNLACKKDSYIEASVEVNDGVSSRDILNTVCDQRKRRTPGGYGLYCGATQNGGTTIVRLKQGERVYVKKIWPLGVSAVFGKGLTSFSGYLLRPS